MQVVTLAAYFIDGIAFATESLAGLFRGQGKPSQLNQLVLVAGGLSLGVGLLFAIAFIGYSDQLFGRLTTHAPVLLYLKQYVLAAASLRVWLHCIHARWLFFRVNRRSSLATGDAASGAAGVCADRDHCLVSPQQSLAMASTDGLYGHTGSRSELALVPSRRSN